MSLRGLSFCQLKATSNKGRLRVKVEGKKGSRLTSDVMPIHVAMEKPYPGIVGPEPDHSVPLRSKQPGIAFDRDFGKWFSITVVA